MSCSQKSFASTSSRSLIHHAKQPVCNKRINSDGSKCRAKLEPVVFQNIAFLRMNVICELAEVKVKLRWIHIVPGRSPIRILIPLRECFHYGRRFTPLSPTRFFFSTICILKNQEKDENGKQKVNILTN